MRMDPARWKTLDRLLELVLERPAHERDALLRHLTDGDAALEQELRALVQLGAETEDFLERPAIEIAARALAHDTADAAAGRDPRIGTTVSHYNVLRHIGAGGMGAVYQAEDTRLQRFVALKFLSEAFGRDSHALSRFRREARAVSALNHPNICTIYDIDDDEGSPFHVMEYLEGSTVQQRIAEGPLGHDLVISWSMEMAEALEAAHRAGIVHRDIKPANIFITTAGHVKILDFGLARLGTARGPDVAETGDGGLIGTPVYMSPEQAEGRPVDARTDLFSFGLVMYEMATGSRAVAGVD